MRRKKKGREQNVENGMIDGHVDALFKIALFPERSFRVLIVSCSRFASYFNDCNALQCISANNNDNFLFLFENRNTPFRSHFERNGKTIDWYMMILVDKLGT